MEPLEGYEVESEAGRAVALALDLDDDLRREGLAREVVHAVQNARKQAGLEITDRISLRLGGDDELIEAARAHEEYVTGEVLATQVAYGDDGPATRGHDRGQDALDRGRASLIRGVCCGRGQGSAGQRKRKEGLGDEFSESAHCWRGCNRRSSLIAGDRVGRRGATDVKITDEVDVAGKVQEQRRALQGRTEGGRSWRKRPGKDAKHGHATPPTVPGSSTSATRA